MLDLCIIGHITKDRIEIHDEPVRYQPGGTVYYAGMTARHLGLSTGIITKANPIHRQLVLSDLEESGVEVRCLPSTETTAFTNSYPGPNQDTRVQQVSAVADSFQPFEFDEDARVYVLGPLTRDEISAGCVEALAAAGRWIALDIQGLIRKVVDVEVVQAPCEEFLALIRGVHVLKASAEEALYVTGAPCIEEAAEMLFAMGPEEVLVTSGSHGSLLFAGGEHIRIPAYPPAELVDCTGCGDTYLAAYLAHRLVDADIEAAGHFAALIASKKIEDHGAFRGTWEDGFSRLRAAAARMNGHSESYNVPVAAGAHSRHA